MAPDWCLCNDSTSLFLYCYWFMSFKRYVRTIIPPSPYKKWVGRISLSEKFPSSVAIWASYATRLDSHDSLPMRDCIVISQTLIHISNLNPQSKSTMEFITHTEVCDQTDNETHIGGLWYIIRVLSSEQQQKVAQLSLSQRRLKGQQSAIIED